jgi:hypothetical protein
LPATHAVHAPPFIPDQPALHVQFVNAVLCTGELELAGQLLQLDDPATCLYFPCAHALHCPSCGPE